MKLILDRLGYCHPGTPSARPDRVSGEVRPGEWVCVAGPNGSGKSTLLRLAAGLLRPREGAVCVRHEGDLRPGDRRFRQAVAYLAQAPHEQILGRTVGDELATGLEWHGVSGSEIAARVGVAAAELGFDGGLERTTASLSAGQRHVLALAAVLLTRPAFLLIDEPLRDLDPWARAEWLERLERLRRQGTGLLTATASAAEASWADRVWMLENGAPGAAEVDPRRLLEPGEALRRGLRAAPGASMDFTGLGQAAAVGTAGRGSLGSPPSPARQASPGMPGCPEISASPEVPGSRLVLEGLRVVRGERVLWEGLDLSVPAAGLAALWAPNGTGKTTLAMVLAGLLAPSAGRIHGPVGWESGRERGRDRGRKPGRICHSALAFQHPEDQLGRASVRAELTGPPNLAPGRAPHRSDPASLLARLGLPGDLLDRPPQTLSAGERRRVALAALAAVDPGFLVLDEPLSGLDAEGSTRVAAWIREQAAERPVWVFSSDLDAAELDPVFWRGLGRGGVGGLGAPPRDGGAEFYLPWAYGLWLRTPGESRDGPNDMTKQQLDSPKALDTRPWIM